MSSPQDFLYHGLIRFFQEYLHFGALGFTLLAILQVFLQALYIHYISGKHRLFSRPGYFPALTYILLTSLLPSFNYFSEVLLINWLILAALDVMMNFVQSSHPRKNIFNAGLLLCLPMLLQFPAIGFILLLIVSLLLFRTFQPAEWLVGLLGYITPIYFLIGILILQDGLPLLSTYPESGWEGFSKPEYPTSVVAVAGGVGLLFIAGLYCFQQQAQRMVIYTRRKWLLILCYILVSAGIALFLEDPLKTAWLLLIPGISFIIAQCYYLEKSKRFSIFILSFSLILVVFCQMAAFK